MQEPTSVKILEDVFYFTYLVASRPGGALYLGRTNDLWERVAEHRRGVGSRHSAKYKCHQLVWFEWFEDHHSAFIRERRMKKWVRQYKINLLEQLNPEWIDLSLNLTEELVFDPKRKGKFVPE